QAVALGGNIHYLTQADLAPPTPNQQPSALPGSQGYYPRSWPIWKAKAMGKERGGGGGGEGGRGKRGSGEGEEGGRPQAKVQKGKVEGMKYVMTTLALIVAAAT